MVPPTALTPVPIWLTSRLPSTSTTKVSCILALVNMPPVPEKPLSI